MCHANLSVLFQGLCIVARIMLLHRGAHHVAAWWRASCCCIVARIMLMHRGAHHDYKLK
jgi:hypothetical protein